MIALRNRIRHKVGADDWRRRRWAAGAMAYLIRHQGADYFTLREWALKTWSVDLSRDISATPPSARHAELDGVCSAAWLAYNNMTPVQRADAYGIRMLLKFGYWCVGFGMGSLVARLLT